jgi:hypothetical protein
MNKAELQNAIRTIVKAEVKACLPHLIAEMAMRSHSNKQPLTEISSANGNRVQVQKPQIARPIQRPSAPKAPVRHTSNPILNAALNETEAFIPDPESARNLAALMQESAANGMEHEFHENELPESAGSPMGAPMKDYSSFLKKMDAAANRSRPA